MVAKTKETSIFNSANFRYVQRLHALDVHTGLEMPGSPVEITASVPGTGDGSNGGSIAFDPFIQHQRSALLLSKGVIYIASASHGDNGPYHGWVIGYTYDGKGFTQTAAYNSTPNGSRAGIWMSGGGPAADSAGNLYVVTGNGTFDTNPPRVNYGDAFLKLTPGSNLTVSDFFTPSNQQALSDADKDLGSGGILLFDSTTVSGHPHLLVGAGKEGTIYLMDRDNLGGFSNADNIVAELPSGIGDNSGYGGSFDTPAFFNNTFYYLGINDAIKAFTLSSSVVHSQNPNFPNGFPDVSALAFNKVAAQNGTVLRITDGGFVEAGSVFTKGKVTISKFDTQFQFQLSGGANTADGFTFTLQNTSPNAVGDGGGDLGYFGIPKASPSSSICTIIREKASIPPGCLSMARIPAISAPSTSPRRGLICIAAIVFRRPCTTMAQT